MHLIRNAITASPHLGEKKKKENNGKVLQFPHLLLSVFTTPEGMVNKCRVHPVLETTDLNMFLNKNTLESSKTEVSNLLMSKYSIF